MMHSVLEEIEALCNRMPVRNDTGARASTSEGDGRCLNAKGEDTFPALRCFEDSCNRSQIDHSSQNTGVTKFSIDEILSPDFGVKKDSETHAHPSVSTFQTGHQESDVSCLSGSVVAPVKTRDEESVTPQSLCPETEDRRAHWPAWVYCTRYSDRPSSGPRSRRNRVCEKKQEEKRPRTAFTNDQLLQLKTEFQECRYLTEQRRKSLAKQLNLSEAQIKIWFQNKRAKLKKYSDAKQGLALQLMSQGLYNHSTVTVKDGLPT